MSDRDDRLNTHLLDRYLAGLATAAEQAVVEAWLAAHSAQGHEATLATLRRPSVPSDDARAALARVIERASAADLVKSHDAVRVEPRTRGGRAGAGRGGAWGSWTLPRWLGYAVATTVVGAAFAWQSVRLVRSRVDASPMRHIVTASGQRATVRLRDGTRVTLGVDSRLRFAEPFGTTERTVYLDGEAFFDVAHADRPSFVVHTSRGTVRDIGTRFDVRAYAGSPALEVAVAEGSVVLTPRARRATTSDAPYEATSFVRIDSTILTASDIGRVDANGGVQTVRNADITAYSAWTRGTLLFEATPLRDVVTQMNRWYDADLRLAAAPLAAVPVSAAFEKESFAEAVAIIAAIADARVRWNGKTAFLHVRQHAR